MFKGFTILDSYSSHSMSCRVYGEVVLSSVDTPCAFLPVSPTSGQAGISLGIFPGLLLTLNP